jgi:hypothetical protein
MKRFVALSALIFAMSMAAHAQVCPGSHLNYYVRDAHGRLIDADANGLVYEGAGSDPKLYGKWTVQSRLTYHNGFDLPSDLALFDKSTNKSLVARGMCGFRGPVDLKLTLGGQVMELHFALPDMGSGFASADFSVDSITFKAGKYQIDMTKPTTAASYGRYGGYFAASAWKPEN